MRKAKDKAGAAAGDRKGLFTDDKLLYLYTRFVVVNERHLVIVLNKTMVENSHTRM